LRIKNKLKAEAEQLPQGYLNVLVIRNARLVVNDTSAKVLLNELEEAVHEYPQILLLVVVSRCWRTENRVVSKRDHEVVYADILEDLSQEARFLIVNRFCGTRAPADFFSRTEERV